MVTLPGTQARFHRNREKLVISEFKTQQGMREAITAKMGNTQPDLLQVCRCKISAAIVGALHTAVGVVTEITQVFDMVVGLRTLVPQRYLR